MTVADNDGLEAKIAPEVVKEKGKVIGSAVILETMYVIFVLPGLYDESCKNTNVTVDDHHDDSTNGDYKADASSGGGIDPPACNDRNSIEEPKKTDLVTQ